MKMKDTLFLNKLSEIKKKFICNKKRGRQKAVLETMISKLENEEYENKGNNKKDDSIIIVIKIFKEEFGEKTNWYSGADKFAGMIYREFGKKVKCIRLKSEKKTEKDFSFKFTIKKYLLAVNSSHSSKNNKIRIAYLMPWYDEKFQGELLYHAKKICNQKGKGFSLVAGCSDSNPDNEYTLIKKAIDTGLFNVILFVPTQSEYKPLIKLLNTDPRIFRYSNELENHPKLLNNSSKIIVISIDRNIKGSTLCIRSDNLEIGRMAAKQILSFKKKRKEADEIIIFQGPTTNENAILRTNGFLEIIKDSEVKWSIIEWEDWFSRPPEDENYYVNKLGWEKKKAHKKILGVYLQSDLQIRSSLCFLKALYGEDCKDLNKFIVSVDGDITGINSLINKEINSTIEQPSENVISTAFDIVEYLLKDSNENGKDKLSAHVKNEKFGNYEILLPSCVLTCNDRKELIEEKQYKEEISEEISAVQKYRRFFAPLIKSHNFLSYGINLEEVRSLCDWLIDKWRISDLNDENF